MPRILILSGLDPTGAAGLLLDAVLAARSGAAISGFPTCLVAENYSRVERVVPADFRLLKRSVELCLEEGPFQATKIGLIPESIVRDMLNFISENKKLLGFVVLDPVISATSGYAFHKKSAVMLKELMKTADLSLPNLSEFKTIFNLKETSRTKVLEAAGEISPSSILITSFKRTERYVQNLLIKAGKTKLFRTKLLPYEVRGTGCALSTLVSVNLAKGHEMESAILKATKDLSKILARSVPISENLKRIVIG